MVSLTLIRGIRYLTVLSQQNELFGLAWSKLVKVCFVNTWDAAFNQKTNTAWKVSVFGVILCPYSDRIRENKDQNSSEYGHFLRSVFPFVEEYSMTCHVRSFHYNYYFSWGPTGKVWQVVLEQIDTLTKIKQNINWEIVVRRHVSFTRKHFYKKHEAENLAIGNNW